jgi:hypothetical protein
MRTITLPEWVVKRLAALPPGEEMLVVMAVEPAPVLVTGQCLEVVHGELVVAQYDTLGKRYVATVCSCPLGSVGEGVAVLEEWAQGWYLGEHHYNDETGASRSYEQWDEMHPGDDEDDGPPAVWYCANGAPPSEPGLDYERHPASEMPPEFARLHISLTAELMVKRVGEMTEEEAKSTGCGVAASDGDTYATSVFSPTHLAGFRIRTGDVWSDSWAWFCRVRRV